MKAVILTLILLFSGAVHAMESRSLNKEEIEGLEQERNWVIDLLKGHGSDIKLEKNNSDLKTLQTILENGPYTNDAESELIVLGTVYGDILASELGLHWVVVTDEHGEDIGLQYKNTKIFLFPRDMIIKRIEKNEEPDLTFMFNELKKTVEDMINDPSIEGN